MNERDVTEEMVRAEHLRAVNQRNQALYMAFVIFGAFIVMVIFIALLGAAS